MRAQSAARRPRPSRGEGNRSSPPCTRRRPVNSGPFAPSSDERVCRPPPHTAGRTSVQILYIPRMPKNGPAKLSKAALRDAYKKDLAAAWAYFREKYPRHEPYAFVLHGAEGSVRLTPQVLTEQGLTEVARRYVEKGYYETPEEGREALRYAVADSPHFAEMEGRVPTVDALAGPHVEAMGNEKAYELLASAAIEALKALDAGGLFGKGAKRNRLLVVVITDDTEADWGSRSAKALNPRAVFNRFEAEAKLEGDYKSCEGLAVAPDGRSVYSV